MQAQATMTTGQSGSSGSASFTNESGAAVPA
jgi:hypothetical protein